MLTHSRRHKEHVGNEVMSEKLPSAEEKSSSARPDDFFVTSRDLFERTFWGILQLGPPSFLGHGWSPGKVGLWPRVKGRWWAAHPYVHGLAASGCGQPGGRGWLCREGSGPSGRRVRLWLRGGAPWAAAARSKPG